MRYSYRIEDINIKNRFFRRYAMKKAIKNLKETK